MVIPLLYIVSRFFEPFFVWYFSVFFFSVILENVS